MMRASVSGKTDLLVILNGFPGIESPLRVAQELFSRFDFS